METQTILRASESYKELDEYLNGNSIRSFLLVCDGSLQYLKISKYFDNIERRLGIKVVKFNEFQPNPLYESVENGVKLFRESGCDSIIAVGGGSAMDVAKCIGLYSNMDGNGADGGFLKQRMKSKDIRLLVIPTTAGTGSEATRYAVIYYNGEKQSVTHESIIPDAVLFDESVLRTLPVYQKKATLLDALCHSIESFWSVNSTDESKGYSDEAIRLISASMDRYLANDDASNASMLEAAWLAGRAINITQTTAGHAMCYKLTNLYGIAHGHAAALCVRKLWPWMLLHADRCMDPRGEDYLKDVFSEIARAMGCRNPQEAAEQFENLVDRLKMPVPQVSDNDYEVLKTSVNPVRLKNHPVRLDTESIDELYHRILKTGT